ncbi:MAG: DEAD/DEAH box helicase [Paludibacter sp.]|nr:DEAD/DEAH box helicase [Paludibacter sp.]
MTDNYSVQSIHAALLEKLKNYINSQYFGGNNLLLAASGELLGEKHVLTQDPYIESNTSYVIRENGLNNADIPESIRNILVTLSKENLGVFTSPYVHQVQSLEAFYKGLDILVTTGTGSGKTECFTWPIVANLVNEAMNTPETWNMRGVRTLLLYPMNALVADQISRLRKMIGDPEHKFSQIFHSFAADDDARRPQFGMYTGRTPYPNNETIKKDGEVAATLQNDILNKSEEFKQQLKSLGRYPGKENLDQFVSSLEEGILLENPKDAELITRHEMQRNCPDILVTNYTMLQYMLIRDIEQPIWEATKKWLHASPENQLLIVIDEAHMYHGSAGGEVSLLIRRLLYRLNIGRDKVRFILTTASIPHETKKQVADIQNFLRKITASEYDQEFEVITGERKKIITNDPLEFSPEKIANIPIDGFQKNDPEKILTIQSFCNAIALNPLSTSNLDEHAAFLYDKLPQYGPIQRLLNITSGVAVNIHILAGEVFLNAKPDDALAALQVLLAILPLAKSNQGQILFPARLHLFFRGLEGVYACTNPNCTHKHTGEGITVGKLFTSSGFDTCDCCGGQIFELVNDRRCGALFLKAFMVSEDKDNVDIDLWRDSGLSYGKNMREVHLYIVPEDGVYIKKDSTKDTSHEGWLDPFTGILHRNKKTFRNKEGYLHVLFTLEEPIPGKYTFKSCPKCGTRLDKIVLSDFGTKGNEPFYNIVSSQLNSQPPTIFNQELIKSQPNAGRKVLVFSDSRQRAAVLAKDMTRSADDEAARTLIVLSALHLKKWSNEMGKPAPLSCLYPVFLELAAKNNVLLFYGEDKDNFKMDKNKVMSKLNRDKTRNKLSDYNVLSSEFSNKPGLYSEQLLKNLGSHYRSLTDLGLCWLVPSSQDKIDDCLDALSNAGIKWEESEFRQFFAAWANNYAITRYCIDETISDEIRRNIARYAWDFGLSYDESRRMPSKIAKILNNQGYNEKDVECIQNILREEFIQRGSNQEKVYLSEKHVALDYDNTKPWYRCKKCSKIFPGTLWNHCAYCGHDTLEILQASDLDRYKFWREPILDAISEGSGKTIKTINTEEHTAQLSFKDQREEMWSTTENYEMRFQNVLSTEDEPIDILSCTTTMEVGIDIGSLTAISLRNVPPRRENYQQRAGRAGRRGSTLSSIVTYAQDGPHDGWYFNHPEDIIAGDARSPWIDANNEKLINRHLNLLLLNQFLREKYTDLYSCGVLEFFNNYYDEFISCLPQFNYTINELRIILPRELLDTEISDSYKSELQTKLKSIKTVVDENSNQYVNEKKATSLLDLLSNEGILPTYSFPQNVVGFHIENESTGALKQRPDRSLDIAISEYAPGKVVVVDKKTYKIGGIYSPQSKSVSREAPAEAYFENPHYYSDLYQCKKRECGWISTEAPKDGLCPFCHAEIDMPRKMLKPWGFAPQNQRSIPEAWAEVEYSYAEEPSYFAEPIKNDLKDIKCEHLKAANRSGKITIINKGIMGLGFNVCKKCGAAEVIEPKSSQKIGGKIDSDRPLKNIYRPYFAKLPLCNHEPKQVYLGHTFTTDMVVFEFELDSQQINTDYRGLWIKSAAISLTEAFHLAASRVLDIDFSDLNAGHRIHTSDGNVYVDIYLYDSLSSGAGYSSGLLGVTDELITTAEELLDDCNCESACHTCLKHYWNQRRHDQLNRFSALDLLKWGVSGTIHESYDIEKQCVFITPLKKRFELENLDIKISEEGDGLYLKSDRFTHKFIVYPAMQVHMRMEDGCIYVSDLEIKWALPSVFAEIKRLIQSDVDS